MTIAAALGSTAGALVLVMIAVLFLWHYFLRCRSRSTTSASTSSQSSAQARQIIELSGQERGSYSSASQIAWRFGIEELNLATKNFCDINLIGHGTFGEAYKGLLQDGTIVAIKRRKAPTNQYFTDEVHLLSSIRHRNLVSLLGYCQESEMQMLIYEYISNGSVTKHLYGASRASSNKLEFKHRLSIAYGVAKGLDHLHGLDSPMVHMNFKTANVLVDEDFIPKVADAGIRSLLYRIDGAAPSRMTIIDPFLDPEVEDLGRFSLKSDVYSFGVFLVELVSGQETRSEKDIRTWVQNCQDLNISALVDQRMSSSFSSEGMGEFLQLIAWCLNKSGNRRPPMNFIVSEIDRICYKEMSLTMIMGEGSTTITLGSQLFK